MTEKSDISRSLARYGFYVSILLFFYGTLFPFWFDFSGRELSEAWARSGLLPYWDLDRGRIHSIPDIVANILLTLPLGFFGALHRGDGRGGAMWRWWVLGFVLGVAAETLQLAIPSRSSSITDACNNAFGVLAGSAAACIAGTRLLRLLSGTICSRECTCLWILTGILATTMLGPFDLSLDIAHIRADMRMLYNNPWESGLPLGDAWIQIAEFAILGALAGRMARTGGPGTRKLGFWGSAAAVLAMPPALEIAQLLVESHAPSFRDLAMATGSLAAGFAVGAYAPRLARPACGFILVSLAIVASGLSPYRFASGRGVSSFEWIPLVEYYRHTTAPALYDAILGFLSFGLAGGLLKLSCTRCSRALVVGYALVLAGAIEYVQLYLPSRHPGVTDMLIACLGAWTGAMIGVGIESGSYGNSVEIARRR